MQEFEIHLSSKIQRNYNFLIQTVIFETMFIQSITIRSLNIIKQSPIRFAYFEILIKIDNDIFSSLAFIQNYAGSYNHVML